MTTLGAYIGLGFRHIVDWAALDHLLFLLVLVAPYRWSDWRRLVLVASAFTLGHTATLALAVSGAVAVPTAVIEFLIPVTIILAAVVNIRTGLDRRPWGWESLLTAGFGLVHGAGFANYLNALFQGPIGLPLLGFNVGIEIGQATILAGLLSVFELLEQARRPPVPAEARSRRSVAVATIGGVWAVALAAQRFPW